MILGEPNQLLHLSEISVYFTLVKFVMTIALLHIEASRSVKPLFFQFSSARKKVLLFMAILLAVMLVIIWKKYCQ